MIAAPGKGFNIEDVICTTLEGNSLNESNYSNLWRLIERALAWIEPEFERLCEEIKGGTGEIPRETLLSQPDVIYRAPRPMTSTSRGRKRAHPASDPGKALM